MYYIFMKVICGVLILALAFASCGKPENPPASVLPPLPPGTKNEYVNVATGKTTPDELISFARSLSGVPYKYGSVNPDEGFDCSGFVTYVFNHFGIRVPRRSVDFTYVNEPVDLKKAKPGDLILFTGTDSTIRIVGHIGIVVSANGRDLTFIHATSGKGYDVTETPLNLYYQERYMKIIRVFPQNNR